MITDRSIRFNALVAAESVSDFDRCAHCGKAFDAPDAQGELVEQHPDLFMLCKSCGNAEQNLQSGMEEGV